jgi:hypothetical protein
VSGSPYSCLLLLPKALDEDRTLVEVLLLAHLVLEPKRLRKLPELTLSAPARALLELLKDSTITVRAIGLTRVAQQCLWVWGALFEWRDDLAALAIEIASAVDALSVAELTRVGPYEHLLAALDDDGHANGRASSAGDRACSGAASATETRETQQHDGDDEREFAPHRSLLPADHRWTINRLRRPYDSSRRSMTNTRS